MNTKHRIVYNMKYALELQKKGHVVVGTMPNNQNPHMWVWVFETDDTLERDLQALINEGRRNGR